MGHKWLQNCTYICSRNGHSGPTCAAVAHDALKFLRETNEQGCKMNSRTTLSNLRNILTKIVAYPTKISARDSSEYVCLIFIFYVYDYRKPVTKRCLENVR